MKVDFEDLICISENIDLKEYQEYIDKVHKSMEHPEWLGDIPEEELKDLLNNGNKLFIYKKNNEIICSFLYFEGTEKAVKKFMLDCEPQEISLCGPIAVNPDYLRNGLMSKMLDKLLKYSITKNKKRIVTKITKQNESSIQGFLKAGYKFKMEYINSEGEEKNVYVLEI